MSTEEFSKTLESLLSVKPPGVSGSKIRKLTQLAIGSVQSESVIVQKLFTHFKKTPVANKLGVLYVVDAVVRGFFDEARKVDQKIGPDAPEGTFAGGVAHIAFIIESLIDDFINSHQSTELIEKALKVIGIWEKGVVFPLVSLGAMREKLNKELQNQKENNDSTPLLSTTPPGSPPAHVIAAAAGYAAAAKKQNTTSTKAPDTASILQALANIAKQKQPDNSGNNAGNKGASPALNAGSIASLLPLPPPPPSSRIGPVTPASISGNSWDLPPRERQHEHDRGYERNREPARESTYHSRSSRSRSPPPNRNSQSRTPPRNPSSLQPKNIKYDQSLPAGYIRVYSRTIFLGGILENMTENDIREAFLPYAKVQSIIFNKEKRHSFVKLYTREDAVNAKAQLEQLNLSGRTSLRPRWGVGYGPRDCCDYPTGVSVLPINRLTDSDIRWAVNAENGGTGGIPLVESMCIEEPDIEVGTGVSSKLISKKLPSNGTRPRSDMRDDRFNREHDYDRGGQQDYDRERYRERDNRGRDGGYRNNRDGARDRDRYEDRRGGPPHGRPKTGFPMQHPTPSGNQAFPPIPGGDMANMPGFQAFLSSMAQQNPQQIPQFPPTSQSTPFPFPNGSIPPGLPSFPPGITSPAPQINEHTPPPKNQPFSIPPELAHLLQQQKQNPK